MIDVPVARGQREAELVYPPPPSVAAKCRAVVVGDMPAGDDELGWREFYVIAICNYI